MEAFGQPSLLSSISLLDPSRWFCCIRSSLTGAEISFSFPSSPQTPTTRRELQGTIKTWITLGKEFQRVNLANQTSATCFKLLWSITTLLMTFMLQQSIMMCINDTNQPYYHEYLFRSDVQIRPEMKLRYFRKTFLEIFRILFYKTF
jgi:hypothetical protein